MFFFFFSTFLNFQKTADAVKSHYHHSVCPLSLFVEGSQKSGQKPRNGNATKKQETKIFLGLHIKFPEPAKALYWTIVNSLIASHPVTVLKYAFFNHWTFSY